MVGDEGATPWCAACQKPLFDMFSSCIIALVVNQYGEAAVLRQDYISHTYHNLVSGYIKPGETAEDCARREILEELGLEVWDLRLTETYWFTQKDMLMIGCLARVDKAPFRLSGEVERAVWVPVGEALTMVHPEGSVSYDMLARYLAQHR